MARFFIHTIEDDGTHQLIEADGYEIQTEHPHYYVAGDELYSPTRQFIFRATGYVTHATSHTLSEVTARAIAHSAEEAERLREENAGLKADLVFRSERRQLANNLTAGLTKEERELLRDALAFHQLSEEEDS